VISWPYHSGFTTCSASLGSRWRRPVPRRQLPPESPQWASAICTCFIFWAGSWNCAGKPWERHQGEGRQDPADLDTFALSSGHRHEFFWKIVCVRDFKLGLDYNSIHKYWALLPCFHVLIVSQSTYSWGEEFAVGRRNDGMNDKPRGPSCRYNVLNSIRWGLFAVRESCPNRDSPWIIDLPKRSIDSRAIRSSKQSGVHTRWVLRVNFGAIWLQYISDFSQLNNLNFSPFSTQRISSFNALARSSTGQQM
jgi:hypothetical protein